jgi:hypothetical protein
MKLSEALIRRADLQTRIAQLRQRLSQNAMVQEGDQPAEDPQDLLADLRRMIDELTVLIRQINRTNTRTAFGDDRTLTDALAERDTLMLERSVLSDLAKASSINMPRYSRSEVRYVSTVDVAEIQRRIDDLSRQYRELDTRIQELNWQTDLIE